MEERENNEFSIGGQFWNDNKIFSEKSKDVKSENIIFDGASSSIRFIIEYLKIEKDEYILLPAYLCPTIIENFNKYKINIEFYKINIDLSINIDDLERKLQKNKIKAVYIINYFGLYYSSKELDYLKTLKEKEMVIIEDSVQALSLDSSEKIIGDFSFNSLRKFAAIDGSKLISNKKFNIDYSEFEINYKYLNLISRARKEKTLYINEETNSEDSFLKLFNEAEIEYEKNNEISVLPLEEKVKLLAVNYEYIYERRKENFTYLYDNIKKIEGIEIITNINIVDKFIPIGFVILINKRDEIRRALFNKRIFCPVLWDLSGEKFVENFKESKYISEHILMIPIDQRYCKDNYTELIKTLEYMQFKEKY